MSKLTSPPWWRSHGHNGHRIGFNNPEHSLLFFLVEEFPSLRKTNVSIIEGLAVALGGGEGEAQGSLQSPCSNSNNFPVPAPPLQTRVPIQKTHVPAQHQGQDLRQAWRGKQVSQPSGPYLFHGLPEPQIHGGGGKTLTRPPLLCSSYQQGIDQVLEWRVILGSNQWGIRG